MNLIRDCRNCNMFSNCMDIFGHFIDANKCNQFSMVKLKNNDKVDVSCKTCEYYRQDIPHTCDMCTSLDKEEDYSMWKQRDEQ